jgi:hypothetical protein
MRHELPGSRVEGLRFRPFEDILGVGHAQGFATMVGARRVWVHSATPSLMMAWVGDKCRTLSCTPQSPPPLPTAIKSRDLLSALTPHSTAHAPDVCVPAHPPPSPVP